MQRSVAWIEGRNHCVMSAWAVALLVGLFVMMDAVILIAVFRALAVAWNDLAEKYPATAPAPDAVRRSFQSFQLGMFSLGCGVHVAADGDRLHLLPALLLRAAGCRPASIPWDAVSVPTPKSRGLVKARIGTIDLSGPAWVMALAAPDSALKEESSDSARAG